MATLTAMIVSNGADVTDPDAVEDLLGQYQFDGFDARLEGERIVPSGANHCGLRITKPPEVDPDRDNHVDEFFGQLAEHLAEPLVVQCVGTEKHRFPAVGEQYTVFPSGIVRHESLTPPGQGDDTGVDLVLHFPECDGSTDGHTHTVRAETEWGNTNQITVEYYDGTPETFEGTGLTVTGFSG